MTKALYLNIYLFNLSSVVSSVNTTPVHRQNDDQEFVIPSSQWRGLAGISGLQLARKPQFTEAVTDKPALLTSCSSVERVHRVVVCSVSGANLSHSAPCGNISPLASTPSRLGVSSCLSEAALFWWLDAWWAVIAITKNRPSCICALLCITQYEETVNHYSVTEMWHNIVFNTWER